MTDTGQRGPGAVVGVIFAIGLILAAATIWAIVDADDEPRDSEVQEYVDALEPASPNEEARSVIVIAALDAVVTTSAWLDICDGFNELRGTVDDVYLRNFAIENFEDGYGSKMPRDAADHMWHLLITEC